MESKLDGSLGAFAKRIGADGAVGQDHCFPPVRSRMSDKVVAFPKMTKADILSKLLPKENIEAMKDVLDEYEWTYCILIGHDKKTGEFESLSIEIL